MKKRVLFTLACLFLWTGMAMAQVSRITGVVVSAEDNEPIVGASVLVKGTTLGTITDMNGRYSINNIPVNAKSLVISFVGMKTQELAIKGGEQRVVMQSDTELIDEVVVVAYGTQKKSSFTGAASTVGAKSIEKRAITNVTAALEGNASGVQVTAATGQPGESSSIRIRGFGSVNASNAPLYVVDGTIYNGSIGDINPADIESMTILKDAASTSLYGSSAGNGVILITTKRGKTGKPAVSYSASGSVQNIRANYDMLDAAQFMDMYNKQTYEKYLVQYGLGIYEGYVKSSETPTGYTPGYTNDQLKYVNGTDWLKEVTRLGYMQQHNLSINGGSESMRYMASINYMDQDGVVKNNGTSRFSMRLNFDYELSKYVSVGITSSYSQNKYDNVPLGDGENENSGILTAAIRANPALPIYDENGDYYIDPRRATTPNPVSLLEITDKTTKDRIMGSAFITVKPVSGLELKLNLGADRRFQKRSNYLPKTTLEGERNLGSGYISQEDAQDYLMELTASYSKTFKEHNLKVLGGYSFQKFTTEGVSAGNTEFLIDGFSYHNLGAGGAAKPSVGSWASKNSLGSYFARLNYMYANRYLFEATVRADGASNFEPDNRWGFFPSVALGWVMSEEKFMEKTRSWLSNLKWRVSYGQTGNSSVGNRVKDAYSVGYSYVIGGTEKKGVYASKLGNPLLTWETTSEFNAGVDLGFFNDRVRLTAEYFNRRITDLLVSEKKLLSYNEVNKIAANAGATKSQGVEVTLNTTNISTRNFTWNSTLTLAHYNDRWDKRPVDWKPNSYEKKDDPIRAWWAYESEGILQVGEKAPAAQADLLPGQVKIKDQNKDGVINDNDKIYMDNGDPKLTFGFNNSLRYKNLDFTIYFYGETGRKRVLSGRLDTGCSRSECFYVCI